MYTNEWHIKLANGPGRFGSARFTFGPIRIVTELKWPGYYANRAKIELGLIFGSGPVRIVLRVEPDRSGYYANWACPFGTFSEFFYFFIFSQIIIFP